MCGVFGVLSGPRVDASSDRLKQLIHALTLRSQQRGRDASGLATLRSDGSISIVKAPAAPERLLKSRAFRKWERQAFAESPVCAIGHARMATSGDWAEDRNNQPLLRGDIALIHNGVLANSDDLWASHPDPASRKAEVDTEALLALIADLRAQLGGLAAATRHAFGRIEGSASVAAICAKERKLLLATNTGSLYIMRGAGTFVFASERYFLDRLREGDAGKGLGFGEPVQLEPGHAILVDIDSLVEQPFSLTYGEVEFSPRFFSFDAARSAAIMRDWGFVEYPVDRLRQLRRCTRCILPETYPHIAFDANGVCNYCHNMKPTVVEGQSRETLGRLIEGYARAARDKGRERFCILPLSGGRDSCYGTFYLMREFGLKPLTYTYDWGMVTDLARRNIARVCGRLGLENILVSADISRKLDYIRANVSAWLKQPDLGLIPLFMAGDKHFFHWVNRIKEQNGIDLNIWMMSPLENADFKEGFAGVTPHWQRERTDYLSHAAKLRMLTYYGMAFLRNPGYLNASLLDSFTGFLSFYISPRRDYYNLFDFIDWDEQAVNRTIVEEFNWENSPDSPNTWRVGDGTAPFYNYIYCTVAGFTENDTFRSNQIRIGTIDRQTALERVLEENMPRVDGLQWYCERIGIDMAEALRRINAMPRRYAA